MPPPPYLIPETTVLGQKYNGLDLFRRLPYHRRMAKVLRMLEKMGFLESTGRSGEDEATARADVSPVEPAPQHSEDKEPEVRKVRSRRFDAAFEASASSDGPEEYPINKIYESAGIEEPEHGFTVYTLLDMMDAEEFSGEFEMIREKEIIAEATAAVQEAAERTMLESLEEKFSAVHDALEEGQYLSIESKTGVDHPRTRYARTTTGDKEFTYTLDRPLRLGIWQRK